MLCFVFRSRAKSSPNSNSRYRALIIWERKSRFRGWLGFTLRWNELGFCRYFWFGHDKLVRSMLVAFCGMQHVVIYT